MLELAVFGGELVPKMLALNLLYKSCFCLSSIARIPFMFLIHS